MNKSKQRTSFALDSETIELLQSLSSLWKVSQAEVVRRAVRIAAAERERQIDALQSQLRDYWQGGGVCAEAAESYLGEVRDARQSWERGEDHDPS